MKLKDVKPEIYQEACPYPFCILDDFFPDEETLREVLKEWPETKDFSYKACNTSIKYHMSDYEEMGEKTREVIDKLNSPEFIAQLERVTGITGLLPDPKLVGGGLHMIPQGGFLKMHSDFNWHGSAKLMRKINLLLYLNEDWKEEWGGGLELIGPPDIEDTRIVVEPIFNRAVIFNTTSNSWHGHPFPLTCPDGYVRKSLALYYYCKEPEPEIKHSTIYRDDFEDPRNTFETYVV